MMKPYNILEIANVHAGNEDYMLALLDEFSDVEASHGIKFQPFKFDKIALPDFSWYEVYKELYFTPEQWDRIITKASKKWHVWIDTFDEYSFDIAKANLDKVYGFKFQASVLYNHLLVKLFSQLDLTSKKIILNISGLESNRIQEVIHDFSTKLRPQEIILQVGFQSYPTQFIDSGLVKVEELKNQFRLDISFADHIAPEEDEAKYLPVVAFLKGARYIEKHIRLSGDKPKYDFHSSMDKHEYLSYVSILEKYTGAMGQPFINDNEAAYLTGSIQIPVSNAKLLEGTIPNLAYHFEFKRSNQTGLRAHEIQDYTGKFNVLNKDIEPFKTIQTSDFRKAKIATIVACRLKSTRLPRKAVLPIGGLPSVELCLKNCLRFQHVDHTILATSTEAEDAELEKFTYSPQVIFHKGDPDDVIKRYLDIIDKLQIDVVVRVTADMPYVSDEILQILLKSHFEKSADFTRAVDAAVGTNVEIISTRALKYVKGFFPSANYSEYMSWYFVNNPEHFRLNFVELPSELVRSYRLTLDHQEDLDLFERIEAYFKDAKLDFSLEQLFKFLDANPDVANLNSHITLTYKTDQKLIDTLNRVTKINAS